MRASSYLSDLLFAAMCIVILLIAAAMLLSLFSCAPPPPAVNACFVPVACSVDDAGRAVLVQPTNTWDSFTGASRSQKQ